MIKNINLAITNRCNLRCIMCDIWKEKPKIDLPINSIKKIFQSKFLGKGVDITLTGGEPFLHENLSGITEAVLESNQSSLKTISTNGILTRKILKYLNRYEALLPKDFSLHISLDGINMHDNQRGRSLNNILNTIELVKINFPQINIKIKFTITPANYSDLLPTYKFCKERGLDFRVKLVEYAKNYTNKIKKKKFEFSNLAKRKIARDLLKIYKEKIRFDRMDAEFIKNTIKLLLDKLAPLPCKTPFERLFIMPNGDIYSCIHFDKIGNLNKESLDEAWGSEKANFIRNCVGQNKCNKCVSYHGLCY